MKKTYYEVLKISRDADQQQIKRAYRKLALRFHPDLSKDNSASAAKFREIEEAYHVLSDPLSRKDYDEFGSAEGSEQEGTILRTFSKMYSSDTEEAKSGPICRKCKGSGKINRAVGFFAMPHDCDDCNGTGQLLNKPDGVKN